MEIRKVWRIGYPLGISLTILVIALAAFGVTRPFHGKVSTSVGPGLVTETLAQPNLPILIENVYIVSEPITRSIRLEYTATNRGSEPVTQIGLAVVMFDWDRNVRGAEHVTDKIELRPGEKQQRELGLNNLLYVDFMQTWTRYAVGLVGARTPSGQWTPDTPLSDLIGAMSDSRASTAGPRFQADVAPAVEGSCLSDSIMFVNSIRGNGNVQSASSTGTYPNCSCTVTLMLPKPFQP
jgi:hypothetical protein